MANNFIKINHKQRRQCGKTNFIKKIFLTQKCTCIVDIDIQLTQIFVPMKWHTNEML